MTTVQLLVGTKKGAFIFDSDEARTNWSMRGPFCDNWPVLDMAHDPATGAILAASGNEWYGPAVWRSDDNGETWSHSSNGISFGEGEDAITEVWSVEPAGDVLYAGVKPAGLFRSSNGGETWDHVSGLRDHPTRGDWMEGAAGLILHSIVPDRDHSDRVWVGMSSVGVMRTEDGGATWRHRNEGILAKHLPDPRSEFGQCPHKLRRAPDGRLYMQHHGGVYTSNDGADSWTDISAGLPSDYGFPMVVHPGDPETAFVIPLNGDSTGRHFPDGKAAVYRTTDGGASWTGHGEGLPREDAYTNVFRQSMSIDSLDPAGVYFATSTGQVFASKNDGEAWQQLSSYLPPIYSVRAVVKD
jgi:hypothetical protein